MFPFTLPAAIVDLIRQRYDIRKKYIQTKLKTEDGVERILFGHLDDVSLCQFSPRWDPDVVTIQLYHS